MFDAENFVTKLQASSQDVETGPPASDRVLARTESIVGPLPEDLRALLRQSNGISCRRFRLLSAFDESNAKKTWESIERGQAAVFDEGEELAKRFVCVADIGDGYALYDRERAVIWYLEGDERTLRETDLTLPELVETAVSRSE